MRRSVAAAVLVAATHAVSAGEAPAEAPLGATVERCKRTPDFCRALIREAKARAAEAKEACIPNGISDEEIMGRIMRTAEEILEEDPTFGEFSYGVLAGQLIVYLYPCDVVA